MNASKSQKVINTVRENPGIKASEVCEITGFTLSFVSIAAGEKIPGFGRLKNG
jgi:hypothetical protein